MLNIIDKIDQIWSKIVTGMTTRLLISDKIIATKEVRRHMAAWKTMLAITHNEWFNRMMLTTVPGRSKRSRATRGLSSGRTMINNGGTITLMRSHQEYLETKSLGGTRAKKTRSTTGLTSLSYQRGHRNRKNFGRTRPRNRKSRPTPRTSPRPSSAIASPTQ